MEDPTTSALKYDVEIDPSADTSHTRVLRLVGSGMRVLDLGCATGSLAKLLKQQGCSVVGVEQDPDAARLAEAHCERVVIADLDDADDLSAVRDLGPFDVVVAADVLEHLNQPEHALSVAAEVLAAHGYLVTSIPNIAHGSVRLALLAGRFPYSELGLLDKTHVRLYTRASMTAMLGASGFTVSYVEDQQLDPEQGEVLADVDLESIPAEARSAVRDDPDSAVYQFVAVSSPRPADDGLLSALRRLADQVRSLESDLLKSERSLGDAQARHQSEVRELVAQADLAAQSSLAQLEHAHQEAANARLDAETTVLAAKESLLEATRNALAHEVRATALEQRIVALEAHCAALASHEADRQRVESELLAARHELEVIHQSKLWRFGSTYRKLLGNSLARR